MQAPDITVVIPVHDRPEALAKAIGSVLAQSFPGTLELLVVDDASAVPIRLQEDPRVRLVRHTVNRGAAEARNTGMREARGEFIAFLDSDDVWEDDKLVNQLALLRSAPCNLIGVFTTYAFKTSPANRVGPPADVSDWFAYFLHGCRVGPGSTLMFRRDFAAKIGDQDPKLLRFEDWDWLLRAARLGQFALVPGPGALLTLSGRPSLDTVMACAARIEEKWAGHLEPAQLRRLQAALDVERAAAASWNGKRVAMIAHLFRALVNDPIVLFREMLSRVKQRR